MKKILVLFFLLFISTPTYATGTWYPGCEKDAVIYDDSAYQNYAKELQEKYTKKYLKGNDLNTENYNEEVTIPLSLFDIEQHKNGRKYYGNDP